MMDWNIVVAAIVALLISILSGIISHVLVQREAIEKGTQNIIIILGILAAIAIFAGGLLSSWQKSQSEVPTFSGKVGHFDNSKPLSDFVRKHDGKFISLDINMDASTVDATFDSTMPSFTLWVNCPLLQPGEKLSSLPCSEGDQYVFTEPPSNKYILELYRGVNRVKGNFLVEDITGPFSGVYTIRLRPVAKEDVPLK